MVDRTVAIDPAQAVAVTSRLLIDVPAVLTPSHRLQPDVIVMPNMVQAQWNSTSASTDGCQGVAEVAVYCVVRMRPNERVIVSSSRRRG